MKNLSALEHMQSIFKAPALLKKKKQKKKKKVFLELLH